MTFSDVPSRCARCSDCLSHLPLSPDHVKHVQDTDDIAALPLCVMRKHIPTTYQCACSEAECTCYAR